MKSRTPKLVLVLTALLFCYGFLLGGQQLVLTPICEQFGLGVVGMGTMVSILYVASMLSAATMGAVADRIGKKKVLVAFTVVFGAGCLIAAFSGWLPMFVVAMVVIGAGYSVCESLASAVCVDVSPENGARYINLTQCLLSVGAILAPIIMGNLPAFSFDSWRLLYIFCGVPLLVISIVLSRMVFPVGDEPVREEHTGTRQLWLSPVFLALFVGMFLYVGLETGFGYFVEILFSGKPSGAALSAYGISAYWAGMALSRLIYSFWNYQPKRAVRLSFLGAAVCFIALILIGNPWVCVAFCALVGFTYGPIWTSIMAGAAERFPQHKASATGLMSASCGLGGIVYPTLMGLIVDSLDIRVGFLILSLSAIIGAATAFALKNKTPSN